MKKSKVKKKFNRFILLYIILGIIFIIISSRLVYLQAIKSEEYRAEVNNKSTKKISEAAPRGNIIDKNGFVFAKDVQSYVVTYTETDESKKMFLNTIEKVIKILDDNKGTQNDDFALKVNPYRFLFDTTDADALKYNETKFKKDRGFADDMVNKLLKDNPDLTRSKITNAQWKPINNAMMKISAEKTFNMLWTQYTSSYTTEYTDKKKTKKNKLYNKATAEKLEKMTVEEKRRYMVIFDALQMQSYSGYKPITIASNIKKDTAFIISQELSDLPGINITVQPQRTYPNGELGSAFLGYISKIGVLDATKYAEKQYDTSTDYVGISGIEGAFEDRLKGSKGEKYVEVNAEGRMTKETASKEPYPGQNVKLNIDSNVQYAAEKALDATMISLQSQGLQSDGVNTSNATRGAAIAIDVNTGKILALASRPGFNPNDFAQAGGLSDDLLKKYFNPDLETFGKQYIQSRGLTAYNPGKGSDDLLNELFPVDETTKLRADAKDIYPKPLYNYATSTLNPCGSTMKPLTAIAGLSEGVIDSAETVDDTGQPFDIHLKGYQGKCWQQGGHGNVNVITALEQSCNYFFYEVGDRLYNKGGYDLLAKYAWKFGLGADTTNGKKASTGIEIKENYGQVYNMETNKRIKAQGGLVDMIGYIKNGTDVNGNHFKDGIDLSKKSDDSKEIENIKNQIKNLVREQMGSKKKESTNSKSLNDLLSQLISATPSLKSKAFNTKDIQKVTQGILNSIADISGQIYTKGNVYDAAIGQGINTFTPLQLANYVATIANGGTRYETHLVDSCINAEGKVVFEQKPKVLDKIDLSPSVLNTVKQGMKAVVSGEDGTAAAVLKDFPIQNAGKTGSASSSTQDKQTQIGRTSAGVYIGFAPYDKPEIAVCVEILDAGHGGNVAPVVKAMYEAYFKDILTKEYNYTPSEDYMQDMFKR